MQTISKLWVQSRNTWTSNNSSNHLKVTFLRRNFQLVILTITIIWVVIVIKTFKHLKMEITIIIIIAVVVLQEGLWVINRWIVRE